MISTINRLFTMEKSTSEYFFVYKLLIDKMNDIFNLNFNKISNAVDDYPTLKGKY